MKIKMKDKTEMVNHPNHYGGETNPYEAIKSYRGLGFRF